MPSMKSKENVDLIKYVYTTENQHRNQPQYHNHQQNHHHNHNHHHQHAKHERAQKISKYSSISNVKQIEIWSKTTRKLLESTLKKAILDANLAKLNTAHESTTTPHLLNNHNISHVKSSPPSSSTLKRHTDIKINLAKLLDKQAYEFLLTVNGANIKHNCTNVNKHGVVINTEDDFPSWLVKAMSTLILWENENESVSIEEQFPKFEDVYNEILSYFVSLKEPLLSKEITHLFVEILKLLVMPGQSSIHTPKESRKPLHVHQQQSLKGPVKKSCSFELSKLEKYLPDFGSSGPFDEHFFAQSTTSLSFNIQNLVNILKGWTFVFNI